MKTVATFEAKSREKTGKGSARALRREGRIPAILYGKDQAPVNFSIDEQQFMLLYKKGGIQHKLLDMKVDGKTYHVLPRDIQLHPVSDKPEHIDFLKVDDKSRVKVLVPVRLLGTDKCAGVKRGGVINIVRHDLELVSVPDAIPSVITIDVAALDIGDSVHISHVKLPEGVTSYITDRDFTILTITGRGKEEEETPAVAAEGEAAAAGAAAPAAGAAAPAAAPAKKG